MNYLIQFKKRSLLFPPRGRSLTLDLRPIPSFIAPNMHTLMNIPLITDARMSISVATPDVRLSFSLITHAFESYRKRPIVLAACSVVWNDPIARDTTEFV